MGVAIVQVNFNDSSDRTLTGVSTYDRASGGVLIPPNGATFPLSPVVGELFWRTDTSRLYRWNGSTWASETAEADLSGSTTDDLAEGTTNLYYTEARVSANTDVALNTTHRGLTNNPHVVTKTQVGLGDVTNDAQLKRAAADFATFTEKTLPVGADILLLEDSAANGAKKKVQVGNLPGGTPSVFGTYFQEWSNEVSATNTTTTWANHQSRTTATLAAGTYRIGWYAEGRLDNASNDLEMQCVVDDVSRGYLKVEVKDAGPLQRNPFSGFVHIALSAATHTIQFQFRTSNAIYTAECWRSRLEIWRVS